ncbi:hypothetical protein [Photobacterium kishitanii]|uniref:Uncharacterized protein n=1 Tax=Photobacterium kishitanii TaxID=318456 RepID=A0A2T3KLF1_9GAMM|nr:hypothetical protein [Photobacterium kishitanii]PSV00489.1 hypothetical protein C9J27_04975 [Photobacterium kishitanii]
MAPTIDNTCCNIDETVDLESLPRFKINMLIAERLGMSTDVSRQDQILMSIQNGFNKRHSNTIWARSHSKPWEQFNYTDDPQDYARLMIEYQINVHFFQDKGLVVAKSNQPDSEVSSANIEDLGLAVSLAFLKIGAAKKNEDTDTHVLDETSTCADFFNKFSALTEPK